MIEAAAKTPTQIQDDLIKSISEDPGQFCLRGSWAQNFRIMLITDAFGRLVALGCHLKFDDSFTISLAQKEGENDEIHAGRMKTDFIAQIDKSDILTKEEKKLYKLLVDIFVKCSAKWTPKIGVKTLLFSRFTRYIGKGVSKDQLAQSVDSIFETNGTMDQLAVDAIELREIPMLEV